MKTLKSFLLMTSLALVHVTHFTRASEYVDDPDDGHIHIMTLDRHFMENPAIDHVERTGPKKAYIETHRMPRDVKRQRVKSLAIAHDLNKNGLIEREEMKNWLVETLRIIHHHEAEEKMQELDKDKDGFLSRFEAIYLKSETDLEEVAGIEKKVAENKTLTRVDKSVLLHVNNDKRRFAYADIDKDGRLSLEELQPYIQPFNYPRTRELELSLNIEEIDKNKDGYITKNEFIRFASKLQMKYMGDTFHKLDIDNDERLSRDEIAPHFMPDEIRGVEEKVDKAMQEGDHNSDGKVTIDEIIYTEEVASGIATNFGHHLHFIKDEL